MGVLLGSVIWYGNRPFKRAMEELYKLGLGFFEFSLDYPLPDCMERREIAEMRELLEGFGLKIAFHSPSETPIAHPREEIADANIGVLRRCFEFASSFFPLSFYYNLHLNPKVSAYRLEKVKEEIKINGLRSCEEIARIASEFGIPVSVVNDDFVPLKRSDLILEALSPLFPNLYFTFDVGHAIKAEMLSKRGIKGDSYLDYLKLWIEKGGAKILVVHLYDYSFSEKQDHLSIGKGDLDFNAIFELLKSTNNARRLRSRSAPLRGAPILFEDGYIWPYLLLVKTVAHFVRNCPSGAPTSWVHLAQY